MRHSRARARLRAALIRLVPLAALLLVPALLAAQPLRIELVGTEQRAAEPGSRQTVIFLVHNDGDTDAVVALRAVVPAGWSSVVAVAGMVRVGPGLTEAVPVAVVVPAGAGAARYSVRVHATHAGATDVADVVSHSAYLLVPEFRRLTLQQLRAPAAVLPDTEHELALLITNHGNVPESVNLAVRSPAELTARLTGSTVTLAPGAAHELLVRVRVAAAPRRAGRQAVTVQARARGAGAPTAAHSIRVDVLTTAAGGRPVLPAQLSVRAAGHNDGGASVDFRSRGEVAGADVDILARTAPARPSPFGGFDEYRLAVRSDRLTLLLGDHGFHATPLVAGGALRTGAALATTLGPVEVGGALHGDRRTGSDTLLRSASLAWNTTGWLRLAGAYTETSRTGRSGVYSAAVRVQPAPRTTVQLELGRAAAAGELAFDARARTVIGRLSADAALLRKPADYADGQGGYERGRAAATLRLARGLTAGAILERIVWPDNSLLGRLTGLNARTARGFVRTSFATIDYRRTSTMRGIVPEPAVLDAVRVDARASLGPLRLRGNLEHGRIGASTAGDYLRVDASAEARHGSITARVAASRQSGLDWTSLLRRDLQSATGELSAGSATGTRAGIRGTVYRHQLAPAAFFSTDAYWQQQLGHGQQLLLRARLHGNIEDLGLRVPADRVALQLTYIIPIRIPTGREPGSRVSGRAFDAQTGAPLDGALVRIGHSAAHTDAQGRYELRGVPAGTHSIELDPLVEGDAPYFLTHSSVAVAGARTAFDIPLEARATIHGTVRRWGPAAGRGSVAQRALDHDTGAGAVDVMGDVAAFVDLGGIAGAAVEANCGGERLRSVTDELGRFRFAGVIAGHCTIAIPRLAMPEQHALEPAAVELEIEGGETAELQFRVVPRVRRLQMIHEAEVRLEAPVTPRR